MFCKYLYFFLKIKIKKKIWGKISFFFFFNLKEWKNCVEEDIIFFWFFFRCFLVYSGKGVVRKENGIDIVV